MGAVAGEFTTFNNNKVFRVNAEVYLDKHIRGLVWYESHDPEEKYHGWLWNIVDHNPFNEIYEDCEFIEIGEAQGLYSSMDEAASDLIQFWCSYNSEPLGTYRAKGTTVARVEEVWDGC